MDALLDPIIHGTTALLRDYGVWAVFVLMILESACIPAPSEVIMLYAGYLVTTGDATLVEMIAAGVIGNLVGSWIAWGIGAYGGRAFIERHGKWVRLSPHHLEIAERWFERWGTPTVFFSRMLPIVRTFISLPAGVARMPLPKFTLYTVIGCIPWVTMLALVGKALGSKWDEAHQVLRKGDDLIVLAIVGAVCLMLIRYRRSRA
jgi:membrane protein DedA with SNARE-associated domain